VLEEEQKAELAREEVLNRTTDEAERLRLETVVFAHQRAAASDRIIRMTESHENALEEERIWLLREHQQAPFVAGAPVH